MTSADSASISGAPAPLQLRLESNRLTLKVSAVSQRQVLNEVAEAADFAIHEIGNPVFEVRSWDFDQLPLSRALRILIAPHGSILVIGDDGQTIRQLVIVARQQASTTDDSSAMTAADQSREVDEPSDSSTPSITDQQKTEDNAAYRTDSLVQQGSGADSAEPDYHASLEVIYRHQLTTADDPESRIAAAQQLALLDSSDAFSALCLGMADSSASVRHAVILLLADKPADLSLPVLGQALFSEQVAEIRISAVEAIIAYPPSPSTRAFLVHASQDANATVRNRAASFLEQQ